MLFMLSTILEWFVKFPALWAAVGFIVGGLATATASIIVFRRYGDSLVKINDKIVDKQTELIATMERMSEKQKLHYEAEAATAKEESEKRYAKLEAEWEGCRQKLHDERKEWHNESLKMQLLIQDYEGRPDMRTLGDSVANVATLVKDVADLLKKHDKEIDVRWETFMAEMAKITKEPKLTPTVAVVPVQVEVMNTKKDPVKTEIVEDSNK